MPKDTLVIHAPFKNRTFSVVTVYSKVALFIPYFNVSDQSDCSIVSA